MSHIAVNIWRTDMNMAEDSVLNGDLRGTSARVTIPQLRESSSLAISICSTNHSSLSSLHKSPRSSSPPLHPPPRSWLSFLRGDNGHLLHKTQLADWFRWPAKTTGTLKPLEEQQAVVLVSSMVTCKRSPHEFRRNTKFINLVNN